MASNEVNTVRTLFKRLSLNVKVKDWLKYLYNRLFSARYVIKGKCKRCGRCCLNILFSDENGHIKDEAVFLELQRKNKIYRQFYVAGKVDDENDASFGALLFGCKHLKENGSCSRYLIRPIFCRDYPNINPNFIDYGGQTLDDCGFHFGVSKEFKEYLK